MNQVVKRVLGDWRLPVIFAVPALVWVALLWAVFQPVPGTSVTGATNYTFIAPKSTFPVASPTDILTTVPPATHEPATCAHQTVGYIIRTDNGVVTHAQPGIVCP